MEEINHAMEAHTTATALELLESSPLLPEKALKGEILIRGAFANLGTGEVKFWGIEVPKKFWGTGE